MSTAPTLLRVALVLLGSISGSARAAESPPPRPLSPTSALARVGGLTTGYSYYSGQQMSLLSAQVFQGRINWNGFVAEAGLLSVSPFASEGSIAVTLRFGYSSERFSILAGPTTQLAYTAKPPLQLLPSVRAAYSFGDWGLRAGILDEQGLVPAHVGVTVGNFGLSYVAPLGALADAKIRIAGRGSLLLQAFAYRLLNVTSAFATVGAEFDLVGNSSVPGWGNLR